MALPGNRIQLSYKMKWTAKQYNVGENQNRYTEFKSQTKMCMHCKILFLKIECKLTQWQKIKHSDRKQISCIWGIARV